MPEQVLTSVTMNEILKCGHSIEIYQGVQLFCSLFTILYKVVFTSGSVDNCDPAQLPGLVTL